MTWSIVAFDAKTGAFGVTVFTQAFACGGFMPWVRAHVGAVCSQSLTNPYLGPAVLDGLARGLSPRLAIDAAVAGDEGRAVRQLHAVDRHGRFAAWTGRHCVEWAGSVGEDGVSVAGNMLSNDRVARATLDGYNADRDAPLPERMMAALDGGEIGRELVRDLIGPLASEPQRMTFDLLDLRKLRVIPEQWRRDNGWLSTLRTISRRRLDADTLFVDTAKHLLEAAPWLSNSERAA